MASIFSLAFKPITGTFSMGAKVATAHPASRAFAMTGAGAGIGAVGGFASGYDLNSRMEGALKGAAFGAAGGAMAGTAMYPGVLKTGFKGARAAGGAFMRSGIPATLGRGAGKVGRAGMWMAERPGATLAVAGIGYGGYRLATSGGQDFESPTLGGADLNVNYNQQAIAANELGQIGGGTIGTADQMMERFQYANWMDQVGKMAKNTRAGKMAQSASGLVQGLHAGRHG